MREAVNKGEALVLNYHHHGDPSSWCVAICARAESPVELLDLGGELRELAHISGVGGSEDACVPLMSSLAHELLGFYQLRLSPVIYKNGDPLPEEPE